MNDVRQKFLEAAEKVEEPFVLVTVGVLLSGAHEVISNQQKLPEKIEYLKAAYDDDFRLKANPAIRIVGVILI